MPYSKTSQSVKVDQKDSIDLPGTRRSVFARSSQSTESQFKNLAEELLRPHNESLGWTPDYFIDDVYKKFDGTRMEFCNKLDNHFRPNDGSTPAMWEVWPLVEKWLRQKRQQIETTIKPATKQTTEATISTPAVTEHNETPALATLVPPATNEQVNLSHPQIAMLHHYNNQPITRNNADAVAHKYGQTSGQKLLETYGRMTSPLERTATGKNTIKNFRIVIPLLSGKALELANKELATAEKNNNKR